MILAAGLGERMRPLTDHTPKPLLRVAGLPLLEHHIRRLSIAGVTELVINVSHLAQQIIEYCEDGGRWRVAIEWSREEYPLETAGGIARALPLLGAEPFLVINGDIWIDYPLRRLVECRLAPTEAAHLVMVDNPPQHPLGDFQLDANGRLRERAVDARGLTYAGVGLYRPDFFRDLQPGVLPLRPLLDQAIDRGVLGGEYYAGDWEDVGTPERLQALDERIRGVHSLRREGGRPKGGR